MEPNGLIYYYIGINSNFCGKTNKQIVSNFIRINKSQANLHIRSSLGVISQLNGHLVTPCFIWYDSDVIDTEFSQGGVKIFAVTACTHGEDICAAGLFGLGLRAVFLKNATHILLNTVLSCVTVCSHIGGAFLSLCGRFFN